MTPIADMVDAMVAAGASPSAIAVAVRAIEVSVTRRDAERDADRDASRFVTVGRRSKEAIRSAKYREKRKQNHGLAEANDAAKQPASERDEKRDADRDASRRSVTDHCNLLSSSSLLSVSEVSLESKKQVVARARGTRLSADAVLSDADRKFATDNGAADPDALWAEFIDYWIGVPGQRGTKLNWSATWRNRVRTVKKPSARSSNQYAPRPGSKEDTRERTVNVLRSLDPFPRADDARSGEGVGSPVPRLLPFVKSS